MCRREVMAAAAIILDSDKANSAADYKVIVIACNAGICEVVDSDIFCCEESAEHYFKICENNAACFFDKYAMDNCKRVPSKDLEVDIYLAKRDKDVYSMAAHTHYDYSFYKEVLIKSLKERFDYEKLYYVARANAGDLIPSRVADVIPVDVCDKLHNSIIEEAAARILASFDYDGEDDNILLDAVNDYLSPDFHFDVFRSKNMTLDEFVAERIVYALDIQIRYIVRRVFGYDASELA